MRAFLLAACLLVSGASQVLAGSSKISPDLAKAHPTGQVDVIVQFTQIPTAEHHLKVLRRGGTIKRDLGRFKGGAYRMPAAMLGDLAADHDVVYISPDRPIRSAGATFQDWNLDYHTDTVNAPVAWAQGLNGAGIGVAVIDSGVAYVPDLSWNSVTYGQDFTGNRWGSTYDRYGHGTDVSGIIAGNGFSSASPDDFYTFMGIADGVNLINLRVLDRNGEGTDSEVIAAIQSAIQLQSTLNIGVINLSVGRPVWESYQLDPLCQAVEQAWQAGILVVVAAGNYGRDNAAGTYGYGTITAPGNDPYVITVGAMNTMGTPDRSDDVIASYSSKGPTLYDQIVKPDIVAPGNLIISLYNPGETLNQENPENEIPYSLYQTNGSSDPSPVYFILSGTSMAAPMVSGAAALMLQQTPSLTPDQIKARLMLTAFKNLIPSSTATDSATGQVFNEQADIFTVGAGYLDIQAALQDTDLVPATVGSAMSPAATLDDAGNVVLVSNSVLGSDYSILWGTASVWGASILWGTNDIGQSILWGTSTPASESILWGTTEVDPASILWGTGSGGNDGIFWGTSAPGALSDQE